MKTIKQDVRFQLDAFEKIRQIASQDNASMQDTIRKLVDMGIAQTLTKNTSREMTPLEEEMLLTLKSISAMTNILTTNTLDIKKTPYDSIEALGSSIKKTAADSVKKFKDKNHILSE